MDGGSLNFEVKFAFTLEEEVFVEKLEGYVIKGGENKVYLLENCVD